MLKKIGKINIIWLVLLLLLFSSLAFQNLVSAYTWAFIKLVLPLIGFALFLICLLLLLFKRKTRKFAMVISLLLSLISISPFLVTLNILPIAYPAKIDETTPQLTVAFPLEEKTSVGWGGDKIADNLPHAMWASERWAYDFVMRPFDVGSEKLSDYGIYQQKVFAPVDGTVISAKDSEADIPAGSENFKSSEGNHVYLKVNQTGTYILLNHLAKNSVTVKVGDKVKVGQELGLVGNSGSTSEPHLHIHHQRQNPLKVKYSILAEGLPLYFLIDGQSEMPVKGTEITPK